METASPKHANSLARTGVDGSAAINGNVLDGVFGKPHIHAITRESMSVEPEDSVRCSDPEQAGAILRKGAHAQVGEAVRQSMMVKTEVFRE